MRVSHSFITGAERESSQTGLGFGLSVPEHFIYIFFVTVFTSLRRYPDALPLQELVP